MRLYRCANPECATGEFAAERPECPGCGAGKDERSRARFILPLKLVHYDPPSGMPGLGRTVKACDGRPWGEGVMATGVPDAVTCPACKETAEFKAAAAAAGKHPAYDLPAKPAAKPAGK